MAGLARPHIHQDRIHQDIDQQWGDIRVGHRMLSIGSPLRHAATVWSHLADRTDHRRKQADLRGYGLQDLRGTSGRMTE